MHNPNSKAMSETLRQAIDMQAIRCCHSMSQKERQQFFAASVRSGENGYHQTTYRGGHNEGTYGRGARAGQTRHCYHLDGKEFNRLWDMLESYASTRACFSLNFRVKSPDYEDVVAAIRERLIRILTFEGPIFGNCGFSSIAMTAIGQVLAQEGRVRNTDTFQIISKACSTDELLERESEDSDFNGTIPEELIDYNAENTIMLQSGIPPELEYPVAQMLGGEHIYGAADRIGRRFRHKANGRRSRQELAARYLKREVSALLSDDGEPMSKPERRWFKHKRARRER